MNTLCSTSVSTGSCSVSLLCGWTPCTLDHTKELWSGSVSQHAHYAVTLCAQSPLLARAK